MMDSLLKKYPFYIIFFPALPVLIMAANNLGQIEINVIWRPLMLSLLLSLTLFLIAWPLFHDRHRAGLFSFSILLFVLTYGHIFNLVEDRVIGNWVIGRHAVVLILWAALCICTAYLLAFRSNNPSMITMILNVVMLIMSFFQVIKISSYEIKAQKGNRITGNSQIETLLNPKDTRVMPDVYFIILDKYARSDAIKTVYKYDNSEFIQGLEDLGFWVPKCSRSNYAFTVMSLSSQLNLAYVEDLTDDPSLKTTSALIQKNRVHKAYEDIGYTTIAFEMGFSWGNMKDSEYYFDEVPDNIETWSLDPFEILFLRSTIGILMFERDMDIGTEISYSDLEIKAERTRLILKILPEIPQMPGPKFVHAHIITPHNPYIFNADGTINPNAEDIDSQEGYPAQLAFIEPRILEVVERILNESSIPPIIIIEGDHGFGKKYVTSNLLALHLPNNGESGLEDHMTLINVFPHIFNTYFGTNFNYLRDLSYTHTKDWYESVPIEEWNPACIQE